MVYEAGKLVTNWVFWYWVGRDKNEVQQRNIGSVTRVDLTSDNRHYIELPWRRCTQLSNNNTDIFVTWKCGVEESLLPQLIITWSRICESQWQYLPHYKFLLLSIKSFLPFLLALISFLCFSLNDGCEREMNTYWGSTKINYFKNIFMRCYQNRSLRNISVFLNHMYTFKYLTTIKL